MVTFFAVCSLSGQNSRERRPGRTLVIELIHGREKGRTPYTSNGVGKYSNRNHRCKVQLTNDPQRSDPKSPAGKRAGMESGTRSWVDRLN